MNVSEVLKQVARGRYETHFDDPQHLQGEDGSRTASFLLGDEDDGPLVTLYDVPATYQYEAHTHRCHYMSIIVRGSLQVGKKWYHAGDIRLQEHGSVYGPEQAGPEGCLMINIFANRRAAVPSLLPDGRPAVAPEKFDVFLSNVSAILDTQWDKGRKVEPDPV